MSLKILFNSTAPWGSSSYSVLTKRTVPDIVRMGHSLAVNSWYGLQGEPQVWKVMDRHEKTKLAGSVQIFPMLNGAAYGTDTMPLLYDRLGCNLCIACQDVWVIPPAVTCRLNFAPWFPCDHDPAPAGVVNAISASIYPMVYSKWGVEVLAKAGIEAHYVPCSADAHVYAPMDRAEARKKLGVPDSCDFLVSVVAANKDPDDRKGLAVAMQAFAKFAEHHPAAMLYVHTNWGGPVSIGALLDRLGLKGRVIQPDMLGLLMGMLRDDYMQWVYCSSDVLLNPAKSEGFGLPLLESQMCGTPVIATDFSTTNELLFAGWKVSGHRVWSIGADTFRYMANVDSAVDALEDAYAERGNELLRKQARKGAIPYNTETVAEKYWRPALRDIEKIVCGVGGEMKLVVF